MDIQLEKKKGIQKKHIPYIARRSCCDFIINLDYFRKSCINTKSRCRFTEYSRCNLGKFNDYIRLNGQVQPISVVQLSPEEGGIVQEKVVEEGAHVKKEMLFSVSATQIWTYRF